MRLSAKQTRCLRAMDIDVWYSKDNLSAAKQGQFAFVAKSKGGAQQWLWLVESCDISAEEHELLTKINQALQLTLVSSQAVVIDEPEHGPWAAVVCLGMPAAEIVHASLPQKASIGLMQPWGKAHVLVTHSLSSMIQNASCKRSVWNDLKVLNNQLSSV